MSTLTFASALEEQGFWSRSMPDFELVRSIFEIRKVDLLFEIGACTRPLVRPQVPDIEEYLTGRFE